jgi:hypothetical protein
VGEGSGAVRKLSAQIGVFAVPAGAGVDLRTQCHLGEIVADELDRAILLFEDDQLERAAHALARSRGAAVTRNDADRLGEIDDVVSQMQSYLSGDDRAVFDDALTFTFSGAEETSPSPGQNSQATGP